MSAFDPHGPDRLAHDMASYHRREASRRRRATAQMMRGEARGALTLAGDADAPPTRGVLRRRWLTLFGL